MANFDLNAYETVDSRIHRFYQDHPSGRITTELVAAEGQIGQTRWIVKAFIYRDEESDVAGTGYAFELDGSGMANKTSALENGETSAIGRALANIGYSGDKRASREEMAKTQTPAVTAPVDWRAQVAAFKTMDALKDFFLDAQKEGWASPDVMSAVTAKKKELADA